MTDKKIDRFIEDHNMTYLYLLLANLEVERISNLPFTIRKNMKNKVTTEALVHIATNDIPDYVMNSIEKETDAAEAE